MKNRKAIFPGSFDPFTFGHVDIVNSGLKLFETIIIAVGRNKTKKYMFDLNQRTRFIKSIFNNEKRIVVKTYESLTVEFADKEKATHIIRGVRNSIDFEYETTIALANYQLNKKISTIFLHTKKEHLAISSSIVRELILNKGFLNGRLDTFIPQNIINTLLEKENNKKRNQ